MLERPSEFFEMRRLHNFFRFSTEVFSKWSEHKAPKMAAALAYYTIFSLAPILIVAVAVADILFNRDEARTAVMSRLQDFLGAQGSHAVELMVSNAFREHSGLAATLLGLLALFAGAMGALTELQDSLNIIWNAPREAVQGWKAYLKRQFISLAGVLAIGVLLTLSLVSDAILSAFHQWALSMHWMTRKSELWPLINSMASFALLVLSFALLFKYLPRVKVKWVSAWMGSLFTSLFISIGKSLIAFYLMHSALKSMYGAAGSLVIILVWFYYSAQIFFLGAEISCIFNRSRLKAIASSKSES
jgi:membrane protein